MSQPPTVCASESTRTPWLAFLFVWGCFYLADPLELTFSSHPLIQLEDTDLSTMDRVEHNIEQAQSGNVGRQVGMLGLALFGLWGLRKASPRRLRVGAPLGEAILVFLLWCGLTTLWSDAPLVTVRKLVVLGCLCAGALGMARAYPLHQVIRFTLISGGLLLGLGLACETALGNFRPLHPNYRFSGLTWPAYSAWNLSLLVLAVLALPRRRGAAWLLAGAAVGVVVLTKTRAGLGGLAAALLLHAVATWRPRRWVAVASLAGVALSATVLLAEAMGAELGRSALNAIELGRSESVADVSGRAGLWTELLGYLARRPLVGFGYETFWTPSRLLAVGQSNWGAPDAHNGFLNLALGGGIIAAGLYIGVVILGFARAWRCWRLSGDPDYLFACEALLVLVVNTCFVSTQLTPSLHAFIALVLLGRLGFVDPARLPGGPPS